VARLELYDTASCPYIREMRQRLRWKGADFLEYDVEADAAALERMRAPANGQRLVPLPEEGRVIGIGWQRRGRVVRGDLRR
jgi:glutaredoxin 3